MPTKQEFPSALPEDLFEFAVAILTLFAFLGLGAGALYVASRLFVAGAIL